MGAAEQEKLGEKVRALGTCQCLGRCAEEEIGWGEKPRRFGVCEVKLLNAGLELPGDDLPGEDA